MSNIGRTLVLLLVSVILAATVIRLTMGERQNLTLPEQFIKDSVTWIQEIVNKPAQAVAGLFQDMSGMLSLYEENTVLKKALHHYAQLAVENETLRAENARLKEMLNYRSQVQDYQLQMARVAARDPNRWNNMMSIDQGKKNGIQPEMAVVTPGGLVGRVVSVSNFSANVQLISDTANGSRISVVVQGEEQTAGVLDGYEQETGLLIMSKIRFEDPIQPGEQVVTSGWGGMIPPGLLVGTVEEIGVGDYGLTQQAKIRPAADLIHLNEVFIVVNYHGMPPSPEEPPATGVQAGRK